jgi:nucleoside-diphosphate-sugar epimerase
VAYVLVTGASGFLGRAVVAALLRTGHRVRALVRPGADLSALGWGTDVHVHRADLCSSPDLGEAFSKIDVLVHLAALMRGDERAIVETAVTGTQRLLEAMALTPVKRLVLASSFSVYDWSAVGDVLTEGSPLESGRLEERDAYAIAKTRQEELVRRMSREHGWDLIVLRPAAIWGPGHLDLPDVGRLIGPLYLIVDPAAPMRLSYVENCADAFVKAASNGAVKSGTFNVVDRESISAWEYARRIMRTSGRIRVPVPVSGRLVREFATLAWAIHRTLFRGKGRLPGVLVPRRFDARFKRCRCPNDALSCGLGWSQRLSFDQAISATESPTRHAPSRATS